tara:strand:+ start:2112 stop:2591 length:480 start_codon:yes stop_codon:yes gene_type:complete
MRISLLFIVLFFVLSSCTEVELLPAESTDVIKKIESYKGDKAVILNIWALWCVPCVEEFPMIVELGKQNNELEVIFVSADFEEQYEDVKIFLNKQGVKPFSYIKKEKDEAFIEGINSKWSGSLPFTVVFSKKSGSIVDSWEGKEPESRFEIAVNIALNS